MGSNEEQPGVSNLQRWLFIMVFSLLLCLSTFLTARAVTQAAAAERLAKSGRETNFRMYQLHAKYPTLCAITVIIIVVLVVFVSREPGPQALRRPGRIVIVGVLASSIAYTACQLLFRTRDHRRAVLGAAPPDYAKMMAYSAKEWKSALYMLGIFTALPILNNWLHTRARRNNIQQVVDAKG